MKLKKQRKKSQDLINYDLMPDPGQDPFEFLSQLRNFGNDEDDFDPASLAGNKHGIAKMDESFMLKEIDIANMVRSVLDENTLVPKDVKIDDGDMPLAKNFYEWTTRDRFAGTVMTPFLEQLLWGIIVYAEFCPVCSDVDWIFDTHAVDDTFQTFEKKVCLLEHGVCPSCKGKKSEFVNSGLMNFYQELAVCAGQRCVTGDTNFLSDSGMLRMSEVCSTVPVGFSDNELLVHNGDELEETSQFYRSTPERTARLVLDNGMTLRGTGDHPVMSDRGFVKLKDIEVNATIPIYLNQQQFGTKELTFSTLVMGALDMFRANFPHLKSVSTKVDDFKPRNATVDPDLYTAVGMLSTKLKNYKADFDTLDQAKFVQRVLNKYIYGIRREGNRVSFVSYKSRCFLATFLGLDYDSAKKPIEGIPYNVRLAPKRLVVAYLSGLFEAGGSAQQVNLRANPTTLSEVNAMLNNLGIASIIRSTTLTVANPIYRARFLQEIGYVCQVQEYKYVRGLDNREHDTLHTRVVRIEDGGVEETYDFTLPQTHRFITNGILSHNSGKSAATGGMLTPYLTHRVLKMQKPNDVFGIAGSTMLHGTFVALTYAQAKETLWEFYYGTLVESKWFQEYHSLLHHYQEIYGQQLLKFNDTFVVYRPRSLMFYPAGPDKRVLRGRTRIFAGVDEIGWFDNSADSKKVKTSAREVYTALDRSLLTIRGAADRLIRAGFDDILTGFSMNVSSPASQRDKICELVRQSIDSTTMYGVLRPTWEVNPSLPRSSRVLTEEYKKNPHDFERDYAANPPLSANPYMTNKDWLKRAIGEKPNKIKLRDVVKNRKRQGQATKWAEIDKIGKSRQPTMFAMDAGYTNNSYACAVGRMLDTGDIQVMLLLEVMPEPGIPLNYSMIQEEVIEEVLLQYNSQVALADRWNSIKILQDIEQGLDIVAEQYSLKYKDIGLTKSYFESGNIILPRYSSKKMDVDSAMGLIDGDNYPACYKNKPVEHFVLQALTVQDTGTQINKGDGLTDDLWRAVCLLVWGLTNEKYDEFMSVPEADEEDERFRPQAFAVSKLGSGGGKTMGTGSNTSFQGNLGVFRRGR